MSHYSETVMEHFLEPRNWGQLEKPDCVGVAGSPGRGRFLVLQVRLTGDQISEVRFQSHGCGATIASGSMLSEMILKRSIAESLNISAEELTAALGGLPPDKKHCSGFAIAALHNAIDSSELKS